VSGEDRADKAREEAAWQDIIAHFGERAHLDDDAPETLPDAEFEFDDSDESEDEHVHYREDDERYVPPPPPPLPRTPPDRLLAWLGVLGSPVAAVALVVINWLADWTPPTWLIGLLILAFLGGFGYLVSRMSNDPGDPWDDGARV
jgi:hypothetical protein